MLVIVLKVQIKRVAAGRTIIIHAFGHTGRAARGDIYHKAAAAHSPHDRQRGHGNRGAKVSRNVIGKNPDGDTEEEAHSQYYN